MILENQQEKMMKTMTFAEFLRKNRKQLRISYRREYRAGTTTKDYQDWAAVFYKIYVEQKHPAVAA